MAVMTVEERQTYFKSTKGRFTATEKCDSCDNPITGTLTYTGERGVYCSRRCYDRAEGADTSNRRQSKKGEADMSEEVSKKKKKKHVQEEEEVETPRKKKKKHVQEEEAPVKKKKSASSDRVAGRYTPGSAMATLYERLESGDELTYKALFKDLDVGDPLGRLRWLRVHGAESGKWKVVKTSKTVKMIVGRTSKDKSKKKKKSHADDED